MDEYRIKLRKDAEYTVREFLVNHICLLPEFREKNCILYENIYISDIQGVNMRKTKGIEMSECVKQTETLDYIICEKENIITGLKFYPSEYRESEETLIKTYLQGMGVLAFTENVRQELLYNFDHEQIFQYLARRIQNYEKLSTEQALTFHTLPITDALKNYGMHDFLYLEKEQLITKNDNIFLKNKNVFWPTEYGQSSGIIRSYYVENEEIYYTLRCTSKAQKEIERIKRWKSGKLDIYKEFVEEEN